MTIPRAVEITTDEHRELLYIDGQEIFSEDGEVFDVPFSLLKDVCIDRIPVGFSIALCDRVIGTQELYHRNPSAVFEHSEINGIVIHLDTAIIADSDTMEFQEGQRYLKEAVSAATTCLRPLIETGTVLNVDHHVQEEIAYVSCTLKVPTLTFAEAEAFISDIEDRVMDAHSLPRLFVCHAIEDKDFVDRLVRALDSYALHIWYDKREIFVGDSIVAKVNEGIKQADFLVAVLSHRAVEKPWVQREISASLMRQLRDNGIRVLPVTVDECEVPELLLDIRYADFRVSFEAGLRDLIDSIRRHSRLDATE